MPSTGNARLQFAFGARWDGRAKAIDDPYPALVHLVGLEKAAHEDRGAAAGGAGLHEVTRYLVIVNHVEASLEVREAEGIAGLPLAEVFREFPVALLERLG